MKGAYIRKSIEGSLHREVHCRELTEASPLEDISIGKGVGKRRNGVKQELAHKSQICVEHSTINVLF